MIWLIKNTDSNDNSLVYITTHGGPLKDRNGLPLDLPPKDELDGDDEALVMYYGFEKSYDIITDDMLRFFLSFLKGDGSCVIIDSCFSGGFNDSIINYNSVSKIIKYSSARSSSNVFNNKVDYITKKCGIDSLNNAEEININSYHKNSKVERFKQGLMEELAADGRIVLMSCGEEEVSSGSIFSESLILGFNGLADFFGNQDGINSAEEAFDFAYPLVVIGTGGNQHPTILDLYHGEFPVTFN